MGSNILTVSSNPLLQVFHVQSLFESFAVSNDLLCVDVDVCCFAVVFLRSGVVGAKLIVSVS